MNGAGASAVLVLSRLHAYDSYPGWLFLFAVLMAAALLFSMVFFVRRVIPCFAHFNHPCALHHQIIMFSDLECDYINPIDLCNKLNQVCAAEQGCKLFLNLTLARAARIRSPRVPHSPFLTLWSMDGAFD